MGIFGGGGKLEAKLLITAEDKTAAAFAAIEKRVASLSKSMGGIGAASGRASRMGAYLGGGAGGSASGIERAAARSAEAARRRHMREIAEARAYRREMLATGAHPTIGLGAGLAAGFAVHEAVKVSADRVHERVRMQVSGMSAQESRLAEVESAKIAADFPAIGQTEIMHMMRNARSIVGSYTEAAEIMGPLTKLRIIAQGARPGQDVTEDFDQLVKGLEIKGVTQDPKKFHQYMEGIAKGLNVFGDTLKPYQYYEMFKYGRQATPMLSEKFMLGTAPTLAQELGGSSYGNAVSGFNRSIVAGRMEHSAMKEMVALGLLKKSDVDMLKTGEVKAIKHGHSVKGWEIAQSDPNAWVRQVLLPALTEKGITDPSAVMKEIGTLFSNKVAAQLVSILATQQSRIDKDMALLDHAPGLSAADKYMSQDPHMAYAGLKASLESMTGTLGAGMAAALTPSMNDLSKAIAGYTARLSEAQAARKNGEESQGSKDLNRVINKALYGVDSEAHPSKVTETEKLDADYRRERARLVKMRSEPGDPHVAKGPLLTRDQPMKTSQAILLRREKIARTKLSGFEKQVDDLLRDAEEHPHRDYANGRISEIDAAHAARLKAARDLADHDTGVKRMMRFAGRPHPDSPLNPELTPFVPETSIGAGGYFPTTRQMSYGGYSTTTGAPKAFGPFLPDGHAGPAAAAAPPDLAAVLNGKVEAKLTGQAEVIVKVQVDATSNLIKATAAATSSPIKPATGTSMGEATPSARTATGKQ